MYKKSIFTLLFLLFIFDVSNAERYKIGDVVENFNLPSAAGDTILLYDYRDKVILIHIWHPI